MKRYSLKLVSIIIIIMFLNIRGASENKIPSEIKPGMPAPNIVLYDLNNKLFNLKKSLSSEYILISFSATYCKPCREEIKKFMEMQNKIGEKKLKIYLVFIDPEEKDIQSYITENSITLPVLHDRYKVAYEKYGVISLPNSFLINKKGIIAYKAIGYHEKHLIEIEKIITK